MSLLSRFRYWRWKRAARRRWNNYSEEQREAIRQHRRDWEYRMFYGPSK